MNAKVGRNDPCPCGSGKKHKQCCLQKKSLSGGLKGKIKAVWINNPAKKEEDLQLSEPANLIERTYGGAISSADKPPQVKPVSTESTSETEA